MIIYTVRESVFSQEFVQIENLIESLPFLYLYLPITTVQGIS